MFKTTRRIIKWCGQFNKRLYIGFIFSFLAKIFVMLPFMAAAYMLNKIILDSQGSQNLNPIWALYSLVFLIGTIFLNFLFDYLRARYQESIGIELAARDRQKVGEVLKRVSLGYFTKHKTGEILNDITTGLDILESMGIRMVDKVVGGYISVLLIFISISILDIRFGLIALAGVVLSFVFQVCISKNSEKHSATQLKATQDLSGAIVEFARGLAVVKSFGAEGITTKSLKKACRDSKDINCKIELTFVPYNSMHLICLKVVSVVISFLALFFFIQGVMSLLIMLIVFFLSFNIFVSVEGISGSAHILGIIENSLNRLEELTNEKNYVDTGEDIDLEKFDIKFENVVFAYEKRNVVDDVSIVIPENTTAAIVGPSGSGKTTLCNLIAGFYDIDKGSIKIGGHDVREFTNDSLLKNISMVFQNVYLFNDTVKNNIRFGKAEATEDEIMAVAKKARCHEFIMKLPDGYDTILGEGGGKLSGGEKQRISIARAMLKDAPIIILDEATASIDPENESHIQQAILHLTKGKTVIIIAHRIATIENADQIIVMNEGKIAESGSHALLKDNDGIYSRFLEIRKVAEDFSI